MVTQPPEVRNAARREHIHQQGRKAKAKAKLARRMATRKQEREDSTGQLRQQRLANNIPRTIENTKEWVGASSSTTTATSHKKERANLDETDQDSDPDEQDDEQQDDVDARNDHDDTMQEGDDAGDAMTRPVQIKSNNPDDPNDIQLDMAGLEDLFAHQESQQQADIDAGLPAPQHKPILLTTSPRPHGPTYAFMNEFQSLIGGKKYVHIVPRKNARFELSKVCKWAAKRGYGAILVVGEDLHGKPGEHALSLSSLQQQKMLLRWLA